MAIPASAKSNKQKYSHSGSRPDITTEETPQSTRTGAQLMCEALEHEGVEIMFGYPGGAIMPFYDSLTSYSLKHILVRHEQAAAHAADGYARVTGKPGVCIATSGPGATNLVTGLATAFMDSVPVVAITGQVASHLIGTDAFQETDILGITHPVTKHSFQIRSARDIPAIIHEAFRIAQHGRPGPVLIDVPKDVQLEKVEGPIVFAPASAKPFRPTLTGNLAESAQVASTMITQAQHPVILAGHGVIVSGAYEELRIFAEMTQIPVVTTLLGISAFPESHPLSIGMPGMHGKAEVNRAIHGSDLLIAVGMRFDDRVAGNVAKFAPNAQIIHIDIDPAEMGKVIAPTVPIVADARVALQAINAQISSIGQQPEHRSAWRQQIAQWQQDYEATYPVITATSPSSYPEPFDILSSIRRATPTASTIVSDVGQHQMWVARFFGYDRPNSHLSSGGLGTMGFAIPAAMGASMGRAGEIVWAIAGDGSVQMNIQELATLRDFNMPVKVAIFNNGYLGMVRQWQQFFHQKNYSEVRISSPDYVMLATAYGIPAFRATRADEIDDVIAKALAVEGPAVIEFVIEQENNVFPMVAPGKSIADMLHQDPPRGGN